MLDSTSARCDESEQISPGFENDTEQQRSLANFDQHEETSLAFAHHLFSLFDRLIMDVDTPAYRIGLLSRYRVRSNIYSARSKEIDQLKYLYGLEAHEKIHEIRHANLARDPVGLVHDNDVTTGRKRPRERIQSPDDNGEGEKKLRTRRDRGQAAYTKNHANSLLQQSRSKRYCDPNANSTHAQDNSYVAELEGSTSQPHSSSNFHPIYQMASHTDCAMPANALQHGESARDDSPYWKQGSLSANHSTPEGSDTRRWQSPYIAAYDPVGGYSTYARGGVAAYIAEMNAHAKSPPSINIITPSAQGVVVTSGSKVEKESELPEEQNNEHLDSVQNEDNSSVQHAGPRNSTPPPAPSASPGSNMRPPLPPISHPFDTYDANIYSRGHESLMPTGNPVSPYLPQGPSLLGPSGNLSDQSENSQLPSIRGTDSLSRWENDPSGPWVPPMAQNPAPVYALRNSSGHMFRHFREPSRSDVSAGSNSHCRLDSGYGGSGENLSASHPNQSQDDDQYSSLDDISDSSKQPRTSDSMTCDFNDTCTHISKNRSEYK